MGVDSDFDSRNYLRRRVSSDFTEELRQALKNRNGAINELVLSLPAQKRDAGTEQKIMQSLGAYFNREQLLFRKKYVAGIKKGILLFFIAVSIMVINAVVSLQLLDNLLSSIIRILLEPSGWFLMWVSFDILYYDLKEVKKEKCFFHELTKLKIYFQSSDLYKI